MQISCKGVFISLQLHTVVSLIPEDQKVLSFEAWEDVILVHGGKTFMIRVFYAPEQWTPLTSVYVRDFETGVQNCVVEDLRWLRYFFNGVSTLVLQESEGSDSDSGNFVHIVLDIDLPVKDMIARRRTIRWKREPRVDDESGAEGNFNFFRTSYFYGSEKLTFSAGLDQ